MKKIKKIEEIGKKEVFDISIANNHNFYYNGTLLHNCDYRGELMIMMRYVSGTRFMNTGLPLTDIKELIGTRIAQLIIQPYAADIIIKKGTVDDTIRGAGGFGSTDAQN